MTEGSDNERSETSSYAFHKVAPQYSFPGKFTSYRNKELRAAGEKFVEKSPKTPVTILEGEEMKKDQLVLAEQQPLQEKLQLEYFQEHREESSSRGPEEVQVKTTFRSVFTQIIAAVAVSCVSFIVGYSSSYTSPAGPSLETHFSITKDEVSWISGLLPFGAIFGGFIGGPLIEFWGRKKVLILTDVIFFVAWLITYFSPHYHYLYASRCVMGISVGISSLIFPVYIGETIQPGVRGTLGLLPTGFGNVGMLVCCVCGFKFEWQGLAGIGALLPIPFLVIFSFIIPETPQWCLSKGRVHEAKKALQWLRGNGCNIDKELELLENENKRNKHTSLRFVDFLSRSNLKPVLIVLGLMLFQQLSGINAVIYYTNFIFKKSGSDFDENTSTVIVISVNFISVFIATLLIDGLGRKVLLYISSSLMIVMMIVLGAYFYVINVQKEIDMSAYGWIPLASFVVYVLGFSLGYGPIPWLMMGELLPSKIRGVAACIATGFNFLITFIVTKTFFTFIEIIGEHGVFWMFSVCLVISLLFTAIFVPETKGQSLEDIQKKLVGDSSNLKQQDAIS